jgi:uncharacterized membrane protein
VSGDGRVVVGESGTRAFRHTATTGVVDLGVLPGTSRCLALAANADGGVIVGLCYTPPQTFAFIWNADDGMRRLDDVLANLGADVSMQLSSANDVSSDGHVIVGEGVNADALTEGWIARLF